jgi:hypothetical protein
MMSADARRRHCAHVQCSDGFGSDLLTQSLHSGRTGAAGPPSLEVGS